MKPRIEILAILLFVCCFLWAQAQQPAFYHLSTAEGLSDNNVYTVDRDKNGILWIGTGEGLNSFDGNRITTYYRQQHPQLTENNIARVLVDDHNKVWVRTSGHYLTVLDEKRRFHRILIGDTADRSGVGSIFYSKKHGLVALKGSAHHFQQGKSLSFQRKVLPFESKLTGAAGFTYFLETGKAVYYRNSRLVIIDYNSLKLEADYPFPGLAGAASINDDELLLFTAKGDVFYRFSIRQQKVIKEYRNMKDQYAMPISGTLRTVARIDSNRFAFTTYFSGLYILDLRTQSLEHWTHDPVNPRSLGGNNTMNIKYDASGYLFVTTQTSGLHFYHLEQKQAFSRPYFMNESREIFDGYIQAIATDKKDNVWMGAQDRLIKWDRKTDKATFIPMKLADGTNISGSETIRMVEVADNGNLWVGTTHFGIYVFDKNLNVIHTLTDSLNGKKTGLPSPFINTICKETDDEWWVGTPAGVCMVNNTNLKVTSLANHPVLSPLVGINCTTIWKDDDGDIWAGSYRGIWHYDKKANKLVNYNTSNGLQNNAIDAINKDNLGNYYFATLGGLSILSPGGKITNYNRSNGLRNDRCEGILKDDKGFMWIGNLNCILRFDPTNKTFAVYEEGYGFSHGGYRMRSAHRSTKGEMFWATDKGLVYFYPEQMSGSTLPLRPAIHALQADNNSFHFTAADSVSFPYSTSSFVFSFSSGELSGDRKTQLLCKLSGFDKEWKRPSIVGQAVYSKLAPGNYTFMVKASLDGIKWYEALYPVELTISTPWWQQAWFRLACLLLAAGGVYLSFRHYKTRKNTRDINQTVEYFASSSYENSSVENILWDISRNCISRLGFEDCVIYLADDEKKVLVQKAAYGPKNPAQFEIANPIEIPFGKGIVGHAAQTGKAIIVNDTTKDPRYIVDDVSRLSEISVPIIHNEKVIGIIDSEHSKKHFFSKLHLQALQTIASLCSTKISRAMAMDAMKKSELELMELNVKMAESKFLNLRLQMNPHFLFNSLSSIQHLIVSQQSTAAYKYLTVFSNFLRSLLNYADKTFIPLDAELKILQMYVELESLRFDQSFSYDIKADESLSNDEVFVPSLMVQPFVENAIWHGLLHKAGDKRLSIHFSNNTDEYLTCTIEDNGIGRQKAEAIQKGKISSMVHESKGIGIIRERLALLQQKTNKPTSLQIEDLYNGNDAAGTKVIITIPYYNPDES